MNATPQQTSTPPNYLGGEDRARWSQLRGLRMLFEGDHKCFYLDGGRTQFPFAPLLVQGNEIKLYVKYNLLKLLSNTLADLLVGEPPRFEASTPEQQIRVNDLARRSLLHPRLHSVAVQTSWAGGGFMEVVRWNEEIYCEPIAPCEIFPQGPLMPDGQYERYVRYATVAIPSATQDAQPAKLLLKTIYEPGVIRRQLSIIGANGNEIATNVPLAQWPMFKTNTPVPEERTGLNKCSIVYFPNKVGEAEGVSDYTGLIDSQDQVNAKCSQLARVLVKHADPKLWLDPAYADDRGNVQVSHDAFFGMVKPEYITWDAQLDAAMKDRDFAVYALCTEAEISPILLGIKQGATPDAARKLRLEATKSLSKVAGKRLLFEPSTARLIEIANQLDQTGPLLRSYPSAAVGVHFRDGLPVDPLDVAQEAATWRGAGLLDVEDGVAMRVSDPVAAERSVERIRLEKQQATPSILFGEPNQTTAPTVGAEEQPPQSNAA